MSETFHFLRPWWFAALLPLAFLLWRLFHCRQQAGLWRRICDAALLPFLLVVNDSRRSRLAEILFAVAAVLVIFALAGPAWKRLPQPLYARQAPLVIILDLSLSMNARDIKPTRLERAKLKIEDILRQRSEGSTALVVYAGHAFVVTPLTQDVETIRLQLKDIDTALMPVQGNRLSIALYKAWQLFDNNKVRSGDILVITDGVKEVVSDRLRTLAARGVRVSVLAIGTDNGAPVPFRQGGFLKDKGNIVIAKTDFDYLKALARAGNGLYARLTPGDEDVQALQRFFDSNDNLVNVQRTRLFADLWREEGPWLLLLVLPLAALAFRRGWLTVVLIFVCLPVPQSAQAVDWGALWSGLWFNKDQQAYRAYRNKQYAEAAKKFKRRDWKASSLYRSGRFRQAVRLWQQEKTDEGYYNQGNALALSGRLKEAVASYDKALKLNPRHEDARYNRDLLKKILQHAGQQPGPGEAGRKQGQQQGKDGRQSGARQKSQNKAGRKPQAGRDGKNTTDPAAGNRQQGMDQDGARSDSHARNEPLQDRTRSDKPAQQHDKGEKKDAQKRRKAQQAKKKPGKAARPEKAQLSELEQAYEQWLRRVPDDPGALLRRKFQRQYLMERNAIPYDFNTKKRW